MSLAVAIAGEDFNLSVALDASIVAFAALLRRKEYTAETRSRARLWQLRWRHVVGYTEAGAVTSLSDPLLFRVDITVWRKGDHGKFGQVIPLFLSGDPFLCPVLALVRRYRAFERTPLPHQLVFVRQDRKFMTGQDISSLLKSAAIAGDLDARHFSTHSLRRGGAQRLRDLGFSEEFIKIYGAWRSTAVRRYAHPPPTECVRVSSALLRSSL